MNEYPKCLFLDDECAIAEDKAQEDALRAEGYADFAPSDDQPSDDQQPKRRGRPPKQ